MLVIVAPCARQRLCRGGRPREELFGGEPQPLDRRVDLRPLVLDEPLPLVFHQRLARAGTDVHAAAPALLDELAASQVKDDDGEDPSPPKQTVSVKTVTVSGIAGVLESEADVDTYLAKYRAALVATLNDGKRITL